MREITLSVPDAIDDIIGLRAALDAKADKDRVSPSLPAPEPTPVPTPVPPASGSGSIPAGDPAGVWPLRLAGAPHAQNVDHGLFWGVEAGVDLGGGFLWECWCRPLGPGYLVSDGYGGAHALLWGLTGPDSGPFGVLGNVWDGTKAVGFGGTYQVALGEWVHLRVSWDGAFLFTHVDGVCDGATPFTGPRKSVGLVNGGGVLWVGGSDHINFHGDLAAMRCWDRGRQHPHLFAAGRAFAPPRVPSTRLTDLPCDFHADYTRPGARTIPDTSPAGVAEAAGGPRLLHPGTVGAWLDTVNVPARGPLPTWVEDPTCPAGRAIGPETLPAECIPASRPAPSGCLAWDSFGRRNQTFAFQQAPSLGETEAGSLGPLAWHASPDGPFGILGGAAVFLTLGPRIAWVDLGTADQDVRVSRVLDGRHRGETGLAFRVLGGTDWCSAAASGGRLHVCRSVGGAVEHLIDWPLDPTHPRIRATALGDAYTFFSGPAGADAADTWTQVGTLAGQPNPRNATAAGLATAFVPSVYIDSLGRYRDFAGFAAAGSAG